MATLPRDDNFIPLQNVYKTINTGSATVTTAGTRVQLTTASTVSKRLDVMAKDTNTGIITVGGTAVVAASTGRTGIALTAGQSYTFYVDDVSDVYIDSTVNGEGVSFVYFD